MPLLIVVVERPIRPIHVKVGLQCCCTPSNAMHQSGSPASQEALQQVNRASNRLVRRRSALVA